MFKIHHLSVQFIVFHGQVPNKHTGRTKFLIPNLSPPPNIRPPRSERLNMTLLFVLFPKISLQRIFTNANAYKMYQKHQICEEIFIEQNISPILPHKSLIYTSPDLHLGEYGKKNCRPLDSKTKVFFFVFCFFFDDIGQCSSQGTLRPCKHNKELSFSNCFVRSALFSVYFQIMKQNF